MKPMLQPGTLMVLYVAVLLLPSLLQANTTRDDIVDRLSGAVPFVPSELAGLDRNSDGLLDAADAIRALASATPTPSATPTATPTLTLTPSPTPGSGLQEVRLAQHSVGTAYDAAGFAEGVVEAALRILFIVYDLNNSTVSYTGTLQSTSASDETFTYSPMPTDKLVVISFNGQRAEFIYHSLTGNGNSQDELIAQHNLDLSYFAEGRGNLRIASAKDYVRRGEGDERDRANRTWNAQWQRTISGTFFTSGETATLNLTHAGQESGYVEPPFSNLDTTSTYTGTISSPSASVTVNESSFYIFLQNSNEGTIVRNFGLTSNSSSSFGGSNYQFQDVNARWEAYTLLNDPGQFNVVKDANYWQSGGQVLKNGNVWGAAGFSGPVTVGTKGPDFELILQGTGEKILLHTLIPDL